jgi:PAS domain S-box-containing protein
LLRLKVYRCSKNGDTLIIRLLFIIYMSDKQIKSNKMSTSLSPPQYPKRNFLCSLGIISAVIGVSEALAMLLLDAAYQWGVVLSPLQGAVFNITLLTALSSPLLWLLAVRPLALPIDQEQSTSNRELLDALENHVLLSITDVQGRIVYANEMFCKVSGYTQDELIGQDHSIVNSGHHDQDYIRNMWHTIAGGQVWRGEFCNRRKDGELYWVDSTIAPVLDKVGKPKQYISIRRDITTRKANELKLTALKRALDASTEMILITNAEGFIQYANPALCQFTGWSENALLGQKPYVLDSPAADQPALSEMQSRLRRSEAWSGRLRGRRRGKASAAYLHPVGSVPATEHKNHSCSSSGPALLPSSGQDSEDALEYWANTNITPILMANGTLSGYVQIQHDVSKQVEQEAALALLQNQANASLEAARDAALQAAHSKTEFLTNMSHEIRTPMNGVLGMLDLLQNTQLSREQSDLIKIATNSAESLLTIINDILDFSKLEAGKIELEKIEFNLPDLVEEVCTLLSSRAHSKGLELNCFLPSDLPLRWQGDPTRIRQVLTNLIGNAVKFTEQGEVSAKVSALPVGETLVSISAAKAVPSLRFEVVDTGIGITAEVQARLFQAFSQADNSTSRRYGGTGLGLSISKDLVELMNGSIGVESTLGQGASFWFTLPLTAVNNQAPVPQAYFAGKRALIVDDNATNRMILMHYLSNWGFTLSEADNGPAALVELEAAVLRNEAYDLLLSDMQMPDMDGFALASAIVGKPAIADIPRILLSSGSIGSQAERLELGFTQSLLKPVRQSQLLDAIIEALQLYDHKTVPVAEAKEVLLDYSDKRVLVVEDNKVNQQVILSQLARFQLKPDLANNGQVALDQLERQVYDLVFMDCQMPVMNGYEATRALREREIAGACPGRSRGGGKSRTPIAALTAHASVGEREKCLSAGMDDYLSKPVGRADLAVVLRRWLGEPIGSARGGKPYSAQGLPRAESRGWDESATLKRLDGDNDLLAEMIDLFLEEAPVSVAELSDALSRTDLLALADTAHAIKGMAGHFCAERIIRLAAVLEHTARNGADADFQLMTHDLSQATLNLVENLHIRKEQNRANEN